MASHSSSSYQDKGFMFKGENRSFRQYPEENWSSFLSSRQVLNPLVLILIKDMDDGREMKEKAQRLNDNYNEIFKYVANADRKNSDVFQKGVIPKDYDRASEMDFRDNQRGRRSKGRSNRQMRGRSFNYNPNFNRSRNNFEPSNVEDYSRDWHDGYRPKSSPCHSNFSNSGRNGKSNQFRHNSRRDNLPAEKLLPLMSDSGSVMSKKSDISRLSCYKDVTPADLITVLSQCEKFSATLLYLLDKHEYNHKEVKVIVEKHYKTFELNGETVILKPKIKMCKAHMETDGCSNRNDCLGLHICPKYIHNMCRSDNCLMGHSWKTNHNQDILKAHLICSLQVPTLNKLFISMMFGDGLLTNDLQICLDYNESGCQNINCSNLHICVFFLAKLCPSDSRTACSLNHNVQSNDIAPILLLCGISVNESPRDILLSINSCPAIKQEIEKCIDRISVASAIISEIKDPEEFASAGDNIQDSKEINNKNEAASKKKVVKTVWSNYLAGDTVLDEICYYSVESYCKYEESGCWRLHCPYHFHWQVCEKGKPWFNLRDFQVFALEKAFCDPQVGTVDMPSLDPSKLESTARGLLVTLQGKSLWEADFDTMKLTLKNQNSQLTASILELRRLCTEDTANEIPSPCFFSWYFLDKNKKWIEYGLVDSTGDTNLISNIKSDDIEKHRRQRPDSPLSFQSSKFNYILDTIELKQRNLETNVTRTIRRRPQPHLVDEGTESTKDNSAVPSTWEQMEASERVRRVTLVHSSEEYQKISSYVVQQGGNYNIIKIERVQNRFLYTAFQNKVQEMISILKSKDAVDIRQLFHGTRPENVPKICEENFDWRLHGSNAGQAYGSGTYFSPLPSTSHSYTHPDPSGHRYMFIAQVAVGSLTIGNSSMVRPPINPQTNLPYDSTGNAATNPTVIVKFDKQEYFPEYIITLG